jgi:membrane protease YdiL (CAAX protease family)
MGSSNEVGINYDNENMIILLKILQAASVIFIFIVPAILFAVFWTENKIGFLGITSKPLFSTFILAAIGMLCALPLINYLAEMNQQLKLPEALKGIEDWMKQSENNAGQLTEAFTKGTSVGVLITNLIVIALLAAISEELFFRGVLQKVMIAFTKNHHIGIWISAILFSAFHLQFYGFFPRMLMGAYLGYIFYWSGSLYPSIVAHFANNGLAVFITWLINRGSIDASVEKIGAENQQWLYAIISAVLVIVCLMVIWKKEKKAL